MTIRIRLQVDIGRCVELLASVHAADGYPLLWPTDPPAWLTPAKLLRAWVAEDERNVMGHMALCNAAGNAAAPLWSTASGLPPQRLTVVAKLFVAPGARGRGGALLARVCAEAHPQGLRPALEVLEHNQRAIALYERVGWRRVASIKPPGRARVSAKLCCTTTFRPTEITVSAAHGASRSAVTTNASMSLSGRDRYASLGRHTTRPASLQDHVWWRSGNR